MLEKLKPWIVLVLVFLGAGGLYLKGVAAPWIVAYFAGVVFAVVLWLGWPRGEEEEKPERKAAIQLEEPKILIPPATTPEEEERRKASREYWNNKWEQEKAKWEQGQREAEEQYNALSDEEKRKLHEKWDRGAEPLQCRELFRNPFGMTFQEARAFLEQWAINVDRDGFMHAMAKLCWETGLPVEHFVKVYGPTIKLGIGKIKKRVEEIINADPDRSRQIPTVLTLEEAKTLVQAKQLPYQLREQVFELIIADTGQSYEDAKMTFSMWEEEKTPQYNRRASDQPGYRPPERIEPVELGPLTQSKAEEIVSSWNKHHPWFSRALVLISEHTGKTYAELLAEFGQPEVEMPLMHAIDIIHHWATGHTRFLQAMEVVEREKGLTREQLRQRYDPDYVRIPMTQKERRDLHVILEDKTAPLQQRVKALYKSWSDPNFTIMGEAGRWDVMFKNLDLIEDRANDRRNKLLQFVMKGDPDDPLVTRALWELEQYEGLWRNYHWALSDDYFEALHATLSALHAGSMDWDEWLKMKLPV